MIRPAHTSPTTNRIPHRKSGQALLESFGIIMLLCLILFGMVQYVLMLTATEVIQHSASASTRAKAVGFNDFMVFKVNRVTTIPNAGVMEWPGTTTSTGSGWENGAVGNMWYNERWVPDRPDRDAQIWQNTTSEQANVERNRIPFFLGAQNLSEMYAQLDYKYWNPLNRYHIPPPSHNLSTGETVSVGVEQPYVLHMPLIRAFSSDGFIYIEKEAVLANHAELYLE